MKKKHKIKRNYCELGEALQAARLEQNLTQRHLSDEMGYSSPQFISNFENGISCPPFKKLKYLSKKLHIPQSMLTKLILIGKERMITEAFGT